MHARRPLHAASAAHRSRRAPTASRLRPVYHLRAGAVRAARARPRRHGRGAPQGVQHALQRGFLALAHARAREHRVVRRRGARRPHHLAIQPHRPRRLRERPRGHNAQPPQGGRLHQQVAAHARRGHLQARGRLRRAHPLPRLQDHAPPAGLALGRGRQGGGRVLRHARGGAGMPCARSATHFQQTAARAPHSRASQMPPVCRRRRRTTRSSSRRGRPR